MAPVSGASRFVRRALRSSTADALVGGLGALSRRIDRTAPATLTVLTYHRVGPADARPDLAPTMVTVDPDGFRGQMDLISEEAAPVSLPQVLACLDGGPPLPARAVLVTFDDGYRDFTDHAWPILLDHGIPAVMFVATAFPGDPSRAFWWDIVWSAVARGRVPAAVGSWPSGTPPMEQFKELRRRIRDAPHHEAEALVTQIAGAADVGFEAAVTMDWATLTDLAAAGLAVAPHTHTHAPLHRLTPAEAQAEIERSMQELRDRGFTEAADVLAYPGGGHNPAVRDAAAAAGIRLAMSTERGVNRLDRLDRMRLRRINIGHATSPGLLRAQLAPSLARVRRWTGGPA